MESFRVVRDEIHHEYSILSDRLSSYITSQSFLMTGFAISLANGNPVWGYAFRTIFPTALCLLGVLLSIRAHPGIAGACRVIGLWHSRQSELLATEDLTDYRVMATKEYRSIQRQSLSFSVAAPWMFGVAWVGFLGLALWIALAAGRAT